MNYIMYILIFCYRVYIRIFVLLLHQYICSFADVTCPQPEEIGEHCYMSSGNQSLYLYSNKLQYMCNKTGK